MNTTILSFGWVAASFTLLAGVAWAQPLAVPIELRDALQRELAKPVSSYPLDTRAATRIDGAIRTWVAAKVTLQDAQVRESQRFLGRKTYLFEVPAADADRKTDLSFVPPADIIQKIPSFFRTDVNFFSYRKFIDEPAKTRLLKAEAVKLATDFLLRNDLVELSQQDAIGESIVRSLHQDNDTGLGGPGDNVVLFQGVVFKRMFMGAPVLNSRISIDLQPDTKEVLALKHHRWTPALLQRVATAPSRSTRKLDDVLGSLNEQVARFAGRAGRASLSRVTSAWFQTEKELIPIVLCQVVSRHGDHEDGFTQPVNLVGTDAVFYTRTTSTQPPATADTVVLSLTSPRWLGSNRFTFRVLSSSDQNIVILSSSDLNQGWVPIATNTLVNGSLYFTNTITAKGQRFFRATLAR